MSVHHERVAELIAELDQPDKPRVRAAVDALTPLAAQSSELRARLEALLGEPRSPHWPAAYILGQLPDPSGAAIRSLLDALDHREPDIRWAMALLLVRIAKSHGEVVALLIDVVTNGTVNQKRMAIYCLRDLALRDTETLTAMLQALRDGDATVRVAAVTSLKMRPDVGAAARDVLLRLFLDDGDLRVRNAAAITLAQLGSPSAVLVEALEQAAVGENPQLKKSALAALAILHRQP